MAQDIKKMLASFQPEATKPPVGHEARFEAKLARTFPERKLKKKVETFYWMKIAAVAVIVLAVSFFGYQRLTQNSIPKNQPVVNNTEKGAENPANPKLSLATLSPDLKKVEEFYRAGINVQLASLKITDDNRELVDGYMQRLAALNKEYERLNAELNQYGPSEATVTALIDNLKLRLELLFKLKNKLKELKNQNNEEFNAIQS
jgi:uncharacterized small protein (DUF1192 family)